MGMRKIMCLHTCLIPAIIKLTLLMLFSQNGDCECIYNFDGIENGITFGLNIDNSDTVFKFTIVNQTGHIMSHKHAIMLTEYSKYYHVSDDCLKTSRCPYPGLIEHLRFGIQDEISCEVTVTVTADKAISELDISGEITVKIDGQTREPKIPVYQLHLNATKECASYTCRIKCKNKKNREFDIKAAGLSEAHKALLTVFTTPNSIQYFPFKYQLLFTCSDRNYPDSTQVTAMANFTFLDISVTSLTETTTISTFRTSGAKFLTEALLIEETGKLFSDNSFSTMSTQKYSEAIISSTLSFININYTYSAATTPTENATVSSGSFLDKPTNVIALSTVAGVAAAGALGTGAYALTSKRCNTVGDENKESEDTKNTDSTDDRVDTKQDV